MPGYLLPSADHSSRSQSAGDCLARRVRRRAKAIVLLFAAGLLAAAGYLYVEPPIYSAVSTLSFTSAADKPLGDVVLAEAGMIPSLQVMQGAVRLMGDAASSAEHPGDPDPLMGLSRQVSVQADRDSEKVRVTTLAPTPEAAAALGNAVVRAFVEQRSAMASRRESRRRADAQAAIWRETTAAKLAERQRAFDEFVVANPNFASAESTDAMGSRIAKLTDALAVAQDDAIAAKAELDSFRPRFDLPEKAGETTAAYRSRDIFGPLDGQTDQLQNEIAPLRKQLELNARSMGSSNPQMIALSNKIKILTDRENEIERQKLAILKTSLEQRADATARKVESLQKLLDEQRDQVGDNVAKAAEFRALSQALDESRQAASAAGSAPAAQADSDLPFAVVKVESNAIADPRAVWPRPGRVLSLGALGGLILAIIGMLWPTRTARPDSKPLRVSVKTITR